LLEERSFKFRVNSDTDRARKGTVETNWLVEKNERKVDEVLLEERSEEQAHNE